MDTAQKWKIGLLSALLPTIIAILLLAIIIFVYQQIAVMGNTDRVRKADYYTQLAEIAPKNATVFFGDSITELCVSEDIYAEYTANTGVPVINRGISAECTDEMLKRIETNIVPLSPKNLVMLMGTNDLSYGRDEEEILSNIRQMLKIIKEKCPQTNVVLQGIYPTDPERDSLYQRFQLRGRENTRISAFNQKLAALAAEEGVVFLDVTPILADDNGNLKKEYTYDGLHPSISGYLAVRDAIIEKLI